MAESATKGLKLLGLNDSDAGVRKTRRVSEISVEGYDTSLQNYATELTLRKHFASCGTILAVSVFKSVAFMRIVGEDAEDKALQLSGTDVGGWTAIVKAAPWQIEPFDYSAPRSKYQRMFVSGYDTRLPRFDIQIALCKHFSSCGEVMDVAAVYSGRAIITIEGERCEEKALDLSGRDMGGMNLVVEPFMRRLATPGKRKKSTCKITGYTLPSIKLELARKKKEKREKKKKKMEIEKEEAGGEEKKKMEKMEMEIEKEEAGGEEKEMMM